MTLREKVYQKVSVLSDSDLRIQLVLAEELYRQQSNGESGTAPSRNRRQVLNEMLEKRESSTYPPDFDYRKTFEEAMEEKYGRFA